VEGCDLSTSICRRVEKKYALTVHCRPVAEIYGNERFDVVVLNHVLEHVQRPVDFLRDVERLLVPGGLVHIAVPNVACWEAVLRGWTSYEPYHLTYFDAKTFKKTIELAGLSCNSVRTYDSFSGWFLAVLRTIMGVNKEYGAVTRPAGVATRNTAIKRNPFIENAYRLLMTSVGGVITPFRRLQGWWGYGDELVCIARKPKHVDHK